jgi:hypothetical protein
MKMNMSVVKMREAPAGFRQGLHIPIILKPNSSIRQGK